MTTFNNSVAELFVLQEQGSGTFITGNEILTAAHVAQQVGDVVSIDVASNWYTGVVTHINPSFAGVVNGQEAISQAGNDFAVISLTSPVEPSIAMSSNVIDGETGSKVGYPGVNIGGVVTGLNVQAQSTTVINTVSNVDNILIDNNPMIQGSSGGALLNAQGQLVGVLVGFDSNYQYSAQLDMHNQTIINGWVQQDEFISDLYHTALGRSPDLSAFNFYENAVNSIGALAVANYFINSAEFKADYGAITFSQDVVLFYQNGLGRLPSSVELSWWENATSNPAVLLAGIAASPEGEAHWSHV